MQALSAGSVVELEELATGDLFARWLVAADPCARARRAVEASGLAARGPEVTNVGVQRVLLGAVLEGDALAHVVYCEVFTRAGDRPEAPGWVWLVELRRTPAGWRVPVDLELMGSASWYVSLTEYHHGMNGEVHG